MEYKYEQIFGDQSLFDGAPEDAEMITKPHGNERAEPFFFKFINSRVYGCSNKCKTWEWCEYPANTTVALRRIIPEPKRWTWEDKKVGRLPEVGAKCRQGHKDEIVIAVTEKFVVTECQDMSVCTTRKDVFMRSYNPIETTEEKSRRERDEWAKKASEFIDDELDCVNLVGEHVMRRFYNAMLSGELPMPKKGGE